MFTLRRMSVAIAASAVAVLGVPATAAVAASNPGYVCVSSDVVLSATPSSLVGGNKVTVEASSQAGTEHPAGTLTVTFLGKTYTSHAAFSKVVKTPVVTKKETRPVTTSFAPDKSCDGNGRPSDPDPSGTYYFAPAPVHTTVTLLPTGASNGGSNGALPNTGGTNLWYIIVGAALLGLGVAIVGTVSSRRTKKFI